MISGKVNSLADNVDLICIQRKASEKEVFGKPMQ